MINQVPHFPAPPIFPRRSLAASRVARPSTDRRAHLQHSVRAPAEAGSPAAWFPALWHDVRVRRQSFAEFGQSGTGDPRFAAARLQPCSERPNRQFIGWLRCMAASVTGKPLYVDVFLLRVRQHVHERCLRGCLKRNRGERIHGNQGTFRRIGKCLGRHDADAQPRVAARAPADDYRLQIARLPAFRGQEFADRRRQVARLAACFIQSPAAAQHLTLGQRHHARPARGLQNQQFRRHVSPSTIHFAVTWGGR